MSIAQVCEIYSTSIDTLNPSQSFGLHSRIAADRLSVNGPNSLKRRKKKSRIFIFLECLMGIYNILLLITSIVMIVLYVVDPIYNFQGVSAYIKI